MVEKIARPTKTCQIYRSEMNININILLFMLEIVNARTRSDVALTAESLRFYEYHWFHQSTKYSDGR